LPGAAAEDGGFSRTGAGVVGGAGVDGAASSWCGGGRSHLSDKNKYVAKGGHPRLLPTELLSAGAAGARGGAGFLGGDGLGGGLPATVGSGTAGTVTYSPGVPGGAVTGGT